MSQRKSHADRHNDVAPGASLPPGSEDRSRTAESGVHPSLSESQTKSVSELVTLARQFYTEKRRKNCLSLTSAILNIDPANKDALSIEAQLQSDLQRDFDRARQLAEDALGAQNPGMADRAA